MDLVRFVGAAASALLLHAGGASAARFIGETEYWSETDSLVFAAEDMVIQRGGKLRRESAFEVRFAAGTTLVVQIDRVGADVSESGMDVTIRINGELGHG